MRRLGKRVAARLNLKSAFHRAPIALWNSNVNR